MPYDLTSIPVCGDFEVGRTRYILMGFAHPANARALARGVPAAQELVDGYRLEKGDGANADALEPLRALVSIYRDEGAQIAAKHAALQARQRAFEEWEKANPEPPPPGRDPLSGASSLRVSNCPLLQLTLPRADRTLSFVFPCTIFQTLSLSLAL